MGTDLTLLLTTANRLPEETAERLRAYLLEVTGGRYPIVSVSQRPIDFGHNICVGEIGQSKYNEYWQLHIGAQAIETVYTAVVDDDTLYSLNHFEHRPAPGVFWYETNYWFCQDGLNHYWRIANRHQNGGGMWGCIAMTETLCGNLAARFTRYPVDPLIPHRKTIWWGEPGIQEGDREYGRHDLCHRGESINPCVVFVHRASMGHKQLSRFYRRYGLPQPENKSERLDQFGTVADLRRKFWNG